PVPKYRQAPEATESPPPAGKTAHVFYSPPANRASAGPAGEAPPLLILIHGGPTSATAAQFRLTTQYWTSRGFAVCDVNYGGSTGYGRDYRNRLRHARGGGGRNDAPKAAPLLPGKGKGDPGEV